jgi:predicted ATP-dependent endonuclease of OLD family
MWKRALYSQETGNNLERSDNGNSSITQKWEKIEAAITTAANKITGNNMNKRKNEARQKALQRDKKELGEIYPDEEKGKLNLQR